MKGDKVGYGATYEASEDEWIGVVPIGYADGWIRLHQGRNVIVNGVECEIVGRVCMDQMMIRLPNPIPMGTVVTLIGEGMPVERVTSAHSRLFGQICFNDQIVIPLRVILAAFGQIFEFFCHRKLFLFRFVVDT